MAQIGRPDSDISVGSWSPFPASPTTLFDKIDEESKDDDTTYIVSSTDEDECEVGLGDVTDPAVGTGHKIRCYAKSPDGAGGGEQITISLIENGNVRCENGPHTVNRTAYGLIEYTLSEAEANSIQNYANLRFRVHINKTDPDEPIRITQAEFECPDAITEFIYAGDVPMAVLPDEPKGVLSKSYAGAISLAVLPDAPVAPLEKAYSGDILLAALPDFPKAILEKSYAGAVALALTPNSAYELSGETEFIYAGDIPLTALPSYASILDRVYQGDIPLVALPSHVLVMDRVYQGAVALGILPDFPKALMGKAYLGAVALVLTPDSGYLLVSPVSEFVYAGDIPVSLLSGFSSGMEKTYSGDIDIAAMLASLYSGIRAAPAAYIPGVTVREPSELLLLADRKKLVLIGEKKPVFISKQIK